MAHTPTNTSDRVHYEHKVAGCALGLCFVLFCGCGLSPGSGPGGDGGPPDDALVDAAQPEYQCLAVFNSEPCAADWSSCQSVNVRMVLDTRYSHKPIYPIGVIVRDASSFERRWQGCWYSYQGNPVPVLPHVDFSTEMLVWHVQHFNPGAEALEPEVWNCGGCLVIVPTNTGGGGEIGLNAFTLVAIPSMDASIQFEDSVAVY